MINSNYKSNEEENIPFGIHPTKDHSHSLAPCAPAFLVGAIGHRRRVPKKEGHQPLYSPPLDHPRDPPLGHPPRPRPPSGTHRALHRATPGLRRVPVRPPSGARPPSGGHPSGCPSALLAHWVSRASLSGHSVGPLHRATPSGFSVGPLRLAHRPTVCINILAYHDYVYIILLWRSTWPEILNI
jgi:hypothetical protein